MAEYSRLASGTVISTGAATSVIIPFIPNFIEISNSTRATAGAGVARAWWMTNMGTGAAFVDTVAAGSNLTTYISAATGGGFSTFTAGLSGQLGPNVLVTSITKSATIPLVTTASAHGLVTGNVVTFQNLYQTATTGMEQIAGIPFYVTVTGATTFTIQYNNNGSNFTAITAGGLNNTPAMRQILYPALYAPGVANIGFLTLGATTTVQTTQPHNFVVGQEIAFRIPSVYGTTQLNSLPNNVIPGSPIYGFVTSVTNANTFVCNINSTGYVAFNPNQTFASFPGLQFPQVLAVGDINSGSLLSNFVPPSFFNGSSSAAVQTINGPAIAGAFCTNTSQGFIIGPSVAGTAADTIYWRAYMHDINYP